MGAPKRVDCFFCGECGVRGREHVFAETWLNELQAGQERMKIERREFDTDALQAARAHTYDSFLCGDICERCNSGWMSSLEAAVKPWIIGIVDKADLTRLQDSSLRLTFSRWAVKTACVIDHIGGLHEIASCVPRQLTSRADSVPEHLHVLVGWQPYEDRSLFAFNQRNTWSKYPYESAELQRSPDEGWFKVAFSIGRLMVLIAGMPATDYRLVIGTGIHVPIWPTTKIHLHHWYYSMRLEGLAPPEALLKFSDLMAVAR
jgi:hypothetical protein